MPFSSDRRCEIALASSDSRIAAHFWCEAVAARRREARARASDIQSDTRVEVSVCEQQTVTRLFSVRTDALVGDESADLGDERAYFGDETASGVINFAPPFDKILVTATPRAFSRRISSSDL